MNKELLHKILLACGYTLNGMLAICTILAAYGGVVNPETSTIPAIMAMTFPIWLILTLVVLIIDLFINKWMAAIQGAVIIVCLGPIISFCPLNLIRKPVTPEQEKTQCFSFMSFNVLGLADYHRPPATSKDSTHLMGETESGISNPTLSWILKQDCDIACLQEFWFRITDQNKTISRALFDSICERYPYRVTGEANGILSKFPIYQVKLRQPQEKTAFYLGAIAEVNGHRTLIISAHLQSIGLDASDKALYHEITEGEGGRKAIEGARRQLLGKLSTAFRNRARQAADLRRQIDSLGVENVIICGDFNDIQDSYATRLLARDDFKSAFSMAGRGPIITYYVNRFYFHIDHILYRGEMDAYKFRRYDFQRSDHYPIGASFIWSPEAKKVNRNHKGIDLIHRDDR